MKLTINGLLELNNEVSSRLSRLESLQQQVSTKERTYFGTDLQNKKETEPQYCPQAIEAKICQLRNHLFKSKSAIKQANASTEVNLEVDVDVLLGSVEAV